MNHLFTKTISLKSFKNCWANVFLVYVLIGLCTLISQHGYAAHSGEVSLRSQTNCVTEGVAHSDNVMATCPSRTAHQLHTAVLAESTTTNNSYIDASLPDAHILRQAVTNAEKGTFHLFSHGRPGELLIDGQWLKKEAIMVFIDNKLIANSQKPTAIHIYGCNFARGEKGRAAVAYLEKELGISIAASTNLTGAEGDWELEVNTQAFNLFPLPFTNSPLPFPHYPHNLQIDNVHYLPPFVGQTYDGLNYAEEEIVIATNNTSTISVTVTDGSGAAITGSPFSVVKGMPVAIPFPSSPNQPLSQPIGSVGNIYTGQGLIFTSSDDFSVNYRSRGEAQAGVLSAKGSSAVGRNFKWAVPRGFQGGPVHSYLSIFAVEDADVTITDIDPATDITGVTHSGTLTVSLQAGQSIIYEVQGPNTTANIEGHVGANISSTGDIVINTGGQTAQFANTMGGANPTGGIPRDHGIDQIVPIQNLGTEYVVVQGNGGNAEKVFVTATADNTDVFLNGSAVPFATLNEGDQALIPGSNFSAGTMFIETSEPVYVHHALLGTAGSFPTQGLNFIPPLSCFSSFVADEIAKVGQIGTTTYPNTEFYVIETVGATTTVTQNGTVIAPTSTLSIAGTSDYQVLFFSSANVIPGARWSVISDAAVSVSLLGGRGNVGFASYVSDFPIQPSITFSEDDICNPELMVNDGPWMDYQWYLDGMLIPGATSQTYIPTSSGEYTVEVLDGPGTCSVISEPISISVPTLDSDSDGVVDDCDLDDDNDGILDEDEGCFIEVPASGVEDALGGTPAQEALVTDGAIAPDDGYSTSSAGDYVIIDLGEEFAENAVIQLDYWFNDGEMRQMR